MTTLLMSGPQRSAHGRDDPVAGMPLRDIIEWDVLNWSHALHAWWPAVRALDPASARVLTVGERNGGVALWLALLGFRVHCTDYGEPTPEARALHRRHGVADRITYGHADVFALEHADASFDLVACKSVIGGLKRHMKDASTRTLGMQALATAELRRVLVPGGHVLAAENLRATPLHGALRSLVHRGRVGWRHPTPAELRALFDGYAEVTLRCHGFLGTRRLDSPLTRVTATVDRALARLLPEAWQYIGFVVARR